MAGVLCSRSCRCTQGFLDYDLDQSGGLNTLEEVAALLSSLDLLKYVPDELPQNLEPEPTRDMSALWRKAGLVVGLCTRRKMAAAAAGLMTEEDVNLDLEVVNDLENEEDARKVAEENGVSLSGCSGLQAIKDRLASHFGEQRAGAVMKMAVVEHQGMQIDTEDDLAEVLEIVDDLDDVTAPPPAPARSRPPARTHAHPTCTYTQRAHAHTRRR